MVDFSCKTEACLKKKPQVNLLLTVGTISKFMLSFLRVIVEFVFLKASKSVLFNKSSLSFIRYLIVVIDYCDISLVKDILSYLIKLNIRLGW